MESLVLAVSAENAAEILDGKRRFDHRKLPPKRLPARVYLAVGGTGVVGECRLDPAERKTDEGWALPITQPKRYRSPCPLDRFGLKKTPRSFQYVNP